MAMILVSNTANIGMIHPHIRQVKRIQYAQSFRHYFLTNAVSGKHCNMHVLSLKYIASICSLLALPAALGGITQPPFSIDPPKPSAMPLHHYGDLQKNGVLGKSRSLSDHQKCHPSRGYPAFSKRVVGAKVWIYKSHRPRCSRLLHFWD